MSSSLEKTIRPVGDAKMDGLTLNLTTGYFGLSSLNVEQNVFPVSIPGLIWSHLLAF